MRRWCDAMRWRVMRGCGERCGGEHYRDACDILRTTRIVKRPQRPTGMTTSIDRCGCGCDTDADWPRWRAGAGGAAGAAGAGEPMPPVRRGRVGCKVRCRVTCDACVSITETVESCPRRRRKRPRHTKILRTTLHYLLSFHSIHYSDKSYRA